jgi:hypothetical protein
MARYIDIDDFRKNAYYADTDLDIGVYLAEHGYADVAPRAEVAREIFEELDKVYDECIYVNPFTNIGSLQVIKFEQMLAELKKKYTEVQK